MAHTRRLFADSLAAPCPESAQLRDRCPASFLSLRTPVFHSGRQQPLYLTEVSGASSTKPPGVKVDATTMLLDLNKT